MLFFREWIKQKKSNEYVAYDVTSISSYSKNISELEWGYNRDKEKLPQLNLGMYFGEESKLPLYYHTYPGSISDKAHLRHKCCAPEIEPDDIDVSDTVAFTWEIKQLQVKVQ